MKAIFIVLNKQEYLDSILQTFVENNVKGATIIDSQGMGSAIVSGEYSNISLFGSLRNLLKDNQPYSKTIFTVVKDELVEDLIGEIREIFPEKKPGIGFIFTMPVDNIYLLDK